MAKSSASRARRSTAAAVAAGPRGTRTSPAPDDAVAGDTIRVRATEVGYYGDARRRVGDVFTLYPRHGVFTENVLDKDGNETWTKGPAGSVPQRITREVEKTLTAAEQFSESWMERVDEDTLERTTSPNEDLRRRHDAEQAARRPTGEQQVLGGE